MISQKDLESLTTVDAINKEIQKKRILGRQLAGSVFTRTIDDEINQLQERLRQVEAQKKSA